MWSTFKDLIENLTSVINQKSNLSATKFRLINYKTQYLKDSYVYFCKIKGEGINKFIHVKIDQGIDGVFELMDVKLNESRYSEIKVF